MRQEYLSFCTNNAYFYDISRSHPSSDFKVANSCTPEGWTRLEDEQWIRSIPEKVPLPAQGWKVHLSGCPENAERIVEIVSSYCTSRKIAFKFLRSRRVVFYRNSKYASRSSSGKLITIYPVNESQLASICDELGEQLRGEKGPYILTDLRIDEGPLHVRYGSFLFRSCVHDGEQVPAIAGPDGTLVPDRRDPVFKLPDWVTLPDFLQHHWETRNAVNIAALPYEIESALHFSNGGGVYAGRDKRDGRKIVLKEARPYAGLSTDGLDAIARQAHEQKVLERLLGIRGVPQLIDSFFVADHAFTVVDFIEGVTLNKAQVQRYPLATSPTDEQQCRLYAQWAMGILQQIEETVDAIHERGIVFGDLHTSNVMVRPDDTIALIDFEVAWEVTNEKRQTLAAPGFVAPPDRKGLDIDRYALACLRLALFLPLPALLALDPSKATHFSKIIQEHFPVPQEWLDEAVSVILGQKSVGSFSSPPPSPGLMDWQGIRDSLCQSILSTATPERDDRLFPGDIAQFSTGGTNFAHGAAGVMYTLDVTGCGRYPDHERWLLERSTRIDAKTLFGFYEGLHGVAYVLNHLGHRNEALRVIDVCLSRPWEPCAPDLRDGLSGIGLNLAHFADVTGDAALNSAAMRALDIVVDRLCTFAKTPDCIEDRSAGLLRGWTGSALFFIRMYERTNEPLLLDYAARALRADLGQCVKRENGQLQVNEGWRTMPYLGSGSVGIGMVLHQYLAHRIDEELLQAEIAIEKAAQSIFYVQSGLFNGRAGMLLYLSQRSVDKSGLRPRLIEQVQRLSWHKVRFHDGPAFPGEQLLRLSMDLATGTAGVLLALGAALSESTIALPFLKSPVVARQSQNEVIAASPQRSQEAVVM